MSSKGGSIFALTDSLKSPPASSWSMISIRSPQSLYDKARCCGFCRTGTATSLSVVLLEEI